MNLLLTTLVLMYGSQTKGDNIMLGKPSKQSSTLLANSNYGSKKANDGSVDTWSNTEKDQRPYWQGDLQGQYRILNITVTQRWSDILNASIGASLLDLFDPESDVHKCGQWPGDYPLGSLNFLCCLQQPVRFVRIWREDTHHLTIREVSVETPSEQTHRASKYVTEMSKKLNTAGTSLTVAKATECGTLCQKDQNCLALSFREGGQLNCLLGVPGNLVPDTDWRTYIIKDCYNPTTC